MLRADFYVDEDTYVYNLDSDTSGPNSYTCRQPASTIVRTGCFGIFEGITLYFKVPMLYLAPSAILETVFLQAQFRFR